MSAPQAEFHSHLNHETGRLRWAEAEPHFARGMIVKVAAELDIVAVAAAMAADDKTTFSRWLETGQVARANTEDAIHWHDTQAEFWAVVVAPWVLVQEIGWEQ